MPTYLNYGDAYVYRTDRWFTDNLVRAVIANIEKDQPQCFPAGTAIRLPNGSEAAIEDIRVGDLAFSDHVQASECQC